MPIIHTSYYAQQSRARHIHQEANLEKKLKEFKQTIKNPIPETSNYDSFFSAVIEGTKKESRNILKKLI